MRFLSRDRLWRGGSQSQEKYYTAKGETRGMRELWNESEEALVVWE